MLGSADGVSQVRLVQQLDRHRDNFPGPHLELAIESMIAGNTLGDFWEVPHTGVSPLLVLWDKGNNVFYFAGDCAMQSSVASLAGFVAGDLCPQAIAEGVSYFKVRALSASLERCLSQLFPDVTLRPSRTLFSAYGPAQEAPNLRAPLSDVDFVPISPAVLRGDSYAHSEYVRDEIRSMWPSEERFHEYGFGIIAVLDEEIVCACTAEYMSPSRCGIGIATAPNYRQRGVATATAARFVREAHARSITPHWECALANSASVRVAQKVGFMPLTEEGYWVGSFNPKARSTRPKLSRLRSVNS